MEQILSTLLKSGGPLGIITAVLIVMTVIGVYLRQKGLVSIGDKTKIILKDDLSSINTKLGGIDNRLKDVENDLRHRPTRKEVHDLELSMTRLETEVVSIKDTTEKTNRGVNRIEEFMMQSARAEKGK
jgi:archaellum component FlaC